MEFKELLNKTMKTIQNQVDLKPNKINYRKEYFEDFILKIVEGTREFNGIKYNYKQEHGFSFKESEYIYHKIYIENDFSITFENFNGEVFKIKTEEYELNYFKGEISLIRSATNSKITNNYKNFEQDINKGLKSKLILAKGEIINYFFDNLILKGFANEILEEIWNKLVDPFTAKIEYNEFKAKKYLLNQEKNKEEIGKK